MQTSDVNNVGKSNVLSLYFWLKLFDLRGRCYLWDGTGSTEKVGSNSGGEGCSILFLEVVGNTAVIGKTDVGNMEFQATFPL